jgi:hypothetical protein
MAGMGFEDASRNAAFTGGATMTGLHSPTNGSSYGVVQAIPEFHNAGQLAVPSEIKAPNGQDSQTYINTMFSAYAKGSPVLRAQQQAQRSDMSAGVMNV